MSSPGNERLPSSPTFLPRDLPLSLLLDSVSDSVSMLDTDWRYTYVNAPAELLSGKTKSELIGRLVWDVFPDAVGSPFEAEARRAIAEQCQTSFDYFFPPFARWYQHRFYPTGQGLLFLTTDITQRKLLDQEVRQGDSRYRALFEATQDGILIVNDEGRYVDVNQSFCRILKGTREQLLGMHFSDVIPPARLAEAEVAFATLKERNEAQVEFPLRALDGSIVELEWTSTAHFMPGLHFCSCRDVTQRRVLASEREEFLHREKEARWTAELLNSVGPLLSMELELEKLVQSVTDLATKLVGAEFGALFHNVVNEQGEAYMLYTLSGVPREAFAQFPMPRNTAVFAPTFNGEGTLRSDDITKDPRYGHNAPHHGMPQGHLPVRSYLAAPVVSRSGEVLGGLFFGHSTTSVFTAQHERLISGIAAQAAVALDNARLFDQVRRERTRAEETNIALRRANSDLEQFAYSASHDLQEPLRMVAIYSQLLQKRYGGKLDEQGQQYLSYTVEGANRMESLVRDLLAYTRASSLPAQPATLTSSEEALDQALSNLQAAIEQSGAAIVRSPLPDLRMHKVHLEQLFQNLIGNAIKYRSQHPPRIAISSRLHENEWLFSVTDNGIGIDEEYKEQIFGIFKRLHSAAEYSGTGIGLAICHRIVERAGGRIWVESQPGQGSAFLFALPAEAGRAPTRSS